MRFLLLSVLFVPLVLHMHPIPCPAEVTQKFSYYVIDNDIFNWGKSIWLYVVGIGAVGGLIFAEWESGADFYLIATYAFLVDLSAVCSRYPVVSWWGMPNYCEGALAMGSYALLFFWARELLHRNVDRKRVASVLGWVTCFMAVFCSFQLVDPDYFNWPLLKGYIFWDPYSPLHMDSRGAAVFGTLMNSNVLGTFAALLCPFFLARKSWALTLVTLFIVVVCRSRGAWLGIVAGVFWIAFSQRRMRKISLVAAFILISGIVVSGRWSDGGRWYIWQETAKVLPVGLLGEGPGAFALEVKQGGSDIFLKQEVIDRPHNFYLQVWHASGWGSLVLLLILFGRFLKKSFRCERALPFAAGVVSYLVNMFFTDSSTSVAPLFWVMLGTGMAASSFRKGTSNAK